MISVADSYLSSTRTGTDRIVQKGLYMDIQLFSSKDLNSFTQPITGRSWIHIWLFSLTDYEIFKKEASCLSCDEQKRVEKYVHESDRKRYIIGHTALRKLLGVYLHSSPESFTFQAGAHGKPFLNDFSADSADSEEAPLSAPIHFNMSHSANMIVLAFCPDSPIGIDIEAIKDSSCINGIIRRFFHPAEHPLFSHLEDTQKKEMFFRYWTIREAFLKALGAGFSISPNSFCVEPAETEDKRHPENALSYSSLYRITKGREDYTHWRIQSVPAPDGYMCSVAYLSETI